MPKGPQGQKRAAILFVGILALLAGLDRLAGHPIQVWERTLSPIGGAIALATFLIVILAVGLIYLYLPTRGTDA